MADEPGDRARYRRILRFAAVYVAQTWWYELFLARIGFERLAERTRASRMRRFARRFHDLAVELGGLMIKVGQFMSSRLDVLPPEITDELAGLQDEVPPAAYASVRAVAEQDLGIALDRAYARFDEQPMAAASLGQAHTARLSDQDAAEVGFADVVVKVQRPGIDRIVEVDLAALRRVAGWLSHVHIVSDHLDAPALVEEFAHTSREEIDYVREAGYAERFAELFAGNDRVAVPKVVWSRTTTRVLTLSDVAAIKITDVDALRAAGIDPSEVARTFAEVMFDQLFTFGFFHADPHPGNMFVTPRAPDAAGPPWRLTFVDFGMMGEVPTSIRGGMRKLVIAVGSRDGKGLVEAVREVGLLLPSADTGELERAMTQLFARFGGMGFAELREVDPREFRDFATEFGDVVRSLPFQLPDDFLLILRAMSLTSGVCSALDARFNMWDSIEPYAAQLMRDERGDFLQDLAKQATTIAGIAWGLPQRVDAALTRLEDGRLRFDTSHLEHRLARVDRNGRRSISAILFAAVFVGGAVLHAQDAVLGVVLMIVSVLPLLHALFAGLFARGSRR